MSDGHRTQPIRVIFVCGGNSARSQMAEAILRRKGGRDFEAFSAGVWAKDDVHPMTIQVLAEIGIDISDARSKPVTEFLDQRFDYVVTVCDRARESCPVFPGAEESMHWGLDDPVEATGTEGRRLAVFRRVMTEIAVRMRTFIELARRAHPDEAGVAAG
ncbi:MAG TPA: arsenate reductase ArsC [Candidatus Limnocylindrales bacterium]|nr:arsenate reductase ArsC [Candidatus Limnocylindrales bacterium]